MKNLFLKTASITTALLLLFVFGVYAGDLTFNVKSSAGDPIGNVSITRIIGNNTSGNYKTDQYGQYNLSIANGTYSFRLTYNGTSMNVNNISVTNGSSIDIYTTTLRFETLDGNENGVSNVAIDRIIGSNTSGFGVTNSNGVLEKECFPSTHSFRFTYNKTNNAQSVTIGGNGLTPGQVTTFKSYLTTVNFNAYSYNNTGVANINVDIQVSGGYSGIGKTGSNGILSANFYPGTKNFRGQLNGTNKVYSVDINGDGTSAESMTFNMPIARVLFYNYNTPTQNVSVSRVVTGGATGISGNGAYHFPGTYRFIFRSGISRNVTIADGTTNFEKVVSIIRLKDNNGNLTPINAMRGGNGSNINWHVSTATNSPSPASYESDGVWIDLSPVNGNTSRTYEVNKNKTFSTQTKDVYSNNIFDFQTYELTLTLQDCNSNPLSNGSIRVGYSTNMNATPTISAHWSELAPTSSTTDANGSTSAQVFPGAFTLEMTYNKTIETRTIQVAANHTETWTTTKVKINYPNTFVYQRQGSLYWDFFSSSKEMEMLPDNINLSFKSSGPYTVDMQLSIPQSTPSNCNSINGTPVTVRLIDSKGDPIQGATARWADGSWHQFTSATDANGNISELIPGNKTSLKTQMTYKSVTVEKTESLSNGPIVYQTVNVELRLTDFNGDPINVEGTGLKYATGSWQTFGSGTTTNGSEFMELLPNSSLHFAMTVNGTGSGTVYQNVNDDNVVNFKTTKLIVHHTDNNCYPVSGASVKLSDGTWVPMGTTDVNGFSNAIYVFPRATGGYRINAGSSSFYPIPVPAQLEYIFETNNTCQGMMVRVHLSDGTPVAGAPVSKYSGGWTSAGVTNSNGMLFVPGTGNRKFSASYNNTSVSTPSINVSGYQYTDFYTTNVTINGYDDNGDPLSGISTTFYNGGWRLVGVTDNSGKFSNEYFTGTYNFASTYNATSNTQSVTLAGDGFAPGQSTDINTYLSRANFKATSYNGADVKGIALSFYSGGWRSLPATDNNGESSYLMYPGTYTQFSASINGTSSGNFTVTVPGDGQTTNQYVNVDIHPIRVKFYNGNTVVTYYSGGWRSINGDSWYMFPGEYNFTFRSGISQMVEVPPGTPYNFEKTVVVEKLLNSSNNPISGALAEYNDGTWKTAGYTNALGAAIALFDGNVTSSKHFRMTLGAKTQTKNYYNFVSNGYTALFQTTNAVVSFLKSDNTNQTGYIEYDDGSGWAPFGSNSGAITGSQSMELLPVSYHFRMKYFDKWETKNFQNVTSPVVFQTVGATVVFKDSKDNDQTGHAQVQDGSNNWVDFAGQSSMTGTSAPMELLPVSHHVRMTYGSKTQTKNYQSVTSPVQFYTVAAEVTFKDSKDQDQTGYVEYNDGGGWAPFGENGGDITGSETMELLPESHHFRMVYKGKTQTKNFMNTTSTVAFTTKEVTIKATDACDNGIEGAEMYYYDDAATAWVSLGSSDSYGEISDEFLPVSHHFKAVYDNTTKTKNYVALGSVDDVNFDFNKVNEGNCSFAMGDGNGISQNEPEMNITLFPNPAVDELNISIPWINDVTIDVYSADGRIIFHDNYTNVIGTYLLKVSNYAQGTYLIRANFNGQSKTAKFIKK